MDVLCSEFEKHYHLERPHQGLENNLIQKQRKKKCKEPTREPAVAELVSRLDGSKETMSLS